MRKRLRKLRHKLATFLQRDAGITERLAQAELQAQENSRSLAALRFLLTLAPTKASSFREDVMHSKSQHSQDLFVLLALGQKQAGYFIEFGAADGVRFSNTYLLEKQYGWTGIVAEPARYWHEALRANRTSHIETKCVWSKSGSTLSFNETAAPMLSTVSCYSTSDFHAKRRKDGTTYEIETISLLDLLRKYDAPSVIDYLSIDTEGSEYEILSHFDFERYRFRVITCEHNHTAMRRPLFDLLTSKGYERRFEAFSGCDDWYVDSAEPNRLLDS